MKKLAIMVVVLFGGPLLLALFLSSGGGEAAQSPDRVIGDLDQVSMLGSHDMMLEEMRVTADPFMATMTDYQPMWLDSEMIRLQEENQAQLDRMVGRRP